jgi:regulatory protein
MMDTKNDIRMAAMNMLAMREQSTKELTEKLTRKFKDSQSITSVVAQLANENLQSDIRFTEAFISMRKRQGKGPVLIRMELLSKGIEENLIHECLDVDDADWITRAAELFDKRSKKNDSQNKIQLDPQERIKQCRYLQSRGFTQHQIKSAISHSSTA